MIRLNRPCFFQPDALPALRIRRASRFHQRLFGLLGCQAISGFDGLWIEPCASVHTFGMRFAIDLVFVDRDRRIVRIVAQMPPWRACACRGARAAVELRAGEAARLGLHVGQLWRFAVDGDPNRRPS